MDDVRDIVYQVSYAWLWGGFALMLFAMIGHHLSDTEEDQRRFRILHWCAFIPFLTSLCAWFVLVHSDTMTKANKDARTFIATFTLAAAVPMFILMVRNRIATPRPQQLVETTPDES